MARLLTAWLLALSPEPEAPREVQAVVWASAGLTVTELEQSNIAALDLLLANELSEAAVALDRHLTTRSR